MPASRGRQVLARCSRVGARLAVALIALARPADALVVRLDDVLALARARNPVLRAAGAEVDAARGRERQAGLQPANPVLIVEGSRHTIGEAPFFDRGIGLAQEFEVGGQRGLRLATSGEDVRRSEAAAADRLRTVDGEARRAFFALGAAERRQALADADVGLAARVLDAARRRLSTGDASAVDVDLAVVELARREQSESVAETERLRAATRLAGAVGVVDVAIETAESDLEQPVPPGGVDELVARAMAVRPDLQAAVAERRRLESEAALVRRTGLVPNLTMRGFYRQELSDERVAGAELSVPLPVWNRQEGAESALRSSAAGAAAESDRLRQEVVRQVGFAHARLATAQAAWMRYQRAALQAIGSALKRLEDGYRDGYLALSEVLLQEDRLVQARATAIAAWLEVRDAQVDLIEAVGDPEASR